MELATGVDVGFRSAYAPFQDKTTDIALVKGKYVLDVGKGVDLFFKVKTIQETDKRIDDAKYLPVRGRRLPGQRRRLRERQELLLAGTHSHGARLLPEPAGDHRTTA